MSEQQGEYKITMPEYSDWQCQMFGTSHGIVYRPLKGQEPGAWNRFFQRLFLGFIWTKTK